MEYSSTNSPPNWADAFRTALIEARRRMRRHFVSSYVGYPGSMQLEITNRCNFSCKMCPVHRLGPSLNRETGFMELDLCLDIIDQAARFPSLHIIPQGAGESLLHPHLIEILTAIKKHPNLTVGFNTNGSLLTGDLLDAILDCPVDDLGVSLDADQPETFTRITGRDAFDTVIEHTHELIEKRRRRGGTAPRLRVLMVDMAINHHEIPGYVKRWIDQVDEVVILNERDASGRSAERFNFRESRREPCLHLWKTIFIQWDGRYDICCDDWNRQAELPYVWDAPLKDFWFGPDMTAMRDAHQRGRYAAIPICADCRSWIDRPQRIRTGDKWRRITEPLITVFRPRS